MPKKEPTTLPAIALPAINGGVPVPAGQAEAYEALRGAFNSTLEGIVAERQSLQQERADCLQAVARHENAMQAAQAAINEADARASELVARIEAQAGAAQRDVDAAQGAFDSAVAKDGDEGLQKLAERLYEAKTKEQTGTIMLGGLRQRLAGHEAAKAARRQEWAKAEADWRAAWEDVHGVELRLALLDADEAMNHALAATLRARQAQGMLSPAPFLHGIEGASFWFSSGKRAVRWNPMLSSDGNQRGPVAIGAHNLQKLVEQAKLPAGAIAPTQAKEGSA